MSASVKRQFVAEWDSCAIAQRQAEFLREQDPGISEAAAFAQACADSDLYQWEWQDLIDALTETLCEIAPDGRFRAEGRNMGWRHLSGYKDFTAMDGRAFLRALLPNTDCTFRIEREGQALHIRNAHHDAPTGEFYTVVPQPPDTEAAE